MSIFDVLKMLGGLSLFLYGMSAMGDGLAKMAGGKLEGIFEKLTKKRLLAVLLGAGVTAVIQSSSATTVMVVGFVNSGIMKLTQAVGIIMGANIGTTITSWLLSLTGISGDALWVQLIKPSSFSPVLAAVGTILIMSSKGESRKKDVGNILLGFAILMFGMETMSGSVKGLANDPNFCNLMVHFTNPILGMAVGAILTAIIQSSSASVGILQALCITGVIPYSVALPIIMGQNIGTCVTSLISSVGASRNAKRAAMIHLYFNVIGTTLFMIVFYTLNQFVHFSFLSEAAGVAGIAVIHSLFNIAATLVLFPFANLLVKLTEWTIPDTAVNTEEKKKALTLDERFLEKPSFAVEICRQKAVDMAIKANDALNLALQVLMSYDAQKAEEVRLLEDQIDDYEDVLGSFLVKLSSRNLNAKDSQSLSQMLHSISDFERISDLAMDVVLSADEIADRKLSFTEAAGNELGVLCRAVNDIVFETTEVFAKSDFEGATHVEPLEEVIDSLTKKIKGQHVQRLQDGTCTIEMGIILEDVLTNLERVSDHCSKIAVDMLTIRDNRYETHEYLDEMSDTERALFKEEYESLKKKYILLSPNDIISEEKDMSEC